MDVDLESVARSTELSYAQFLSDELDFNGARFNFTPIRFQYELDQVLTQSSPRLVPKYINMKPCTNKKNNSDLYCTEGPEPVRAFIWQVRALNFISNELNRNAQDLGMLPFEFVSKPPEIEVLFNWASSFSNPLWNENWMELNTAEREPRSPLHIQPVALFQGETTLTVSLSLYLSVSLYLYKSVWKTATRNIPPVCVCERVHFAAPPPNSLTRISMYPEMCVFLF